MLGVMYDVHPVTAPVVRVAPSMTAASFSTKPRLLSTAPLPRMKALHTNVVSSACWLDCCAICVAKVMTENIDTH